MPRTSKGRARALGAPARWKLVVAAVCAGSAMIAIVVLSLGTNRVPEAVAPGTSPSASPPTAPARHSSTRTIPTRTTISAATHALAAGHAHAAMMHAPSTRPPSTRIAPRRVTHAPPTSAVSVPTMSSLPTTSIAPPTSLATATTPSDATAARSTRRAPRANAPGLRALTRLARHFESGTLVSPTRLALYRFTVAAGAVRVDATWTGPTRLVVTLYCNGLAPSTRLGVPGGESLVLSSTAGRCALSVALPTNEDGPDSYELVVSFRAPLSA